MGIPDCCFCYSGCGPLGLLTIAVAKASAVRRIIVFDIEESRVNFACQYGADVGIVTPRSLTDYETYTSEVILEHGLEYGVDVAIEASGAEICAQMAVTILKPGGTCTRGPFFIYDFCSRRTLTLIEGIQAGLGEPLTSVPLRTLTALELNIKGDCLWPLPCTLLCR